MTRKDDNTEFERFSKTTKRLMSVSKEEFHRREAEWKRARKHKRKASKKSRGGGVSRDSGDDT
jgi:hypothetical protein